MFHKHRLEALSDAVFAIAMTLLALDLKVPANLAPGQLGAALVHEQNAWLSLGMTFWIAAVFWTLQHRVFDVMKNADRESLVLTFLFLGAITLLPFTTSLVGQQGVESLTFVLYFSNLFIAALALLLKMELANFRDHVIEGADARMLRFRLYRVSFVMLMGAVGAGVLPVKFFYIGPLVAVVIARVVQTALRKRLQG